MICVSIGRTRHKMVTAEHRFLAEKGAELVEFRLDYMKRAPDVARLLKDRPTPVIATCRRAEDGGRWRDSEAERLTVLRTAIVSGAEYVDLESDIAGKVPRFGETKRIVSHHDFKETPADLEKIYAGMHDLDPDIIKIVTTAKSPEDNVRVLKLVADAKVPTVGFCMGETGRVSRLLCAKYGAPFTYATFSSDRTLAPGQFSFDEMKNDYAVDAIGAKTKLYAVIGDPVAHSLSPHIYNPAFRAEGLDCAYIPLRVPDGELRETLTKLSWLDIRGFSVTIPHKEAALKIAEQRDALAEEIGAANTLFRNHEGTWSAANTDCEAAVSSIREGLKRKGESDSTIKGRKVLLLGAGGVSRAIGFGLMKAGAMLTIANRSVERAQALAGELGCQWINWEHRGTSLAEVLVNGTSVGMHPDVDDTPFKDNWFREGMVVFDTVYTPENTLLIKQARERDCIVVPGTQMFIRQAAAQFERFLGRPAPLKVMLEALRRAISPVKLS